MLLQGHSKAPNMTVYYAPVYRSNMGAVKLNKVGWFFCKLFSMINGLITTANLPSYSNAHKRDTRMWLGWNKRERSGENRLEMEVYKGADKSNPIKVVPPAAWGHSYICTHTHFSQGNVGELAQSILWVTWTSLLKFFPTVQSKKLCHKGQYSLFDHNRLHWKVIKETLHVFVCSVLILLQYKSYVA